jgi:hypothetical protein
VGMLPANFMILPLMEVSVKSGEGHIETMISHRVVGLVVHFSQECINVWGNGLLSRELQFS